MEIISTLSDWEIIRPKYKIKEDLGAGTQGQVYRIKERATGKEFALKYIKNIFRNPEFTKCAAREINIMT
jgi:serine/threonine protein kinase